ncbi:MAG TPA: hypothetical protein VNL36_03595 [Bacteroidota bacterium]|nr:hypothetical protein [Bacteroidota bacterium]
MSDRSAQPEGGASRSRNQRASVLGIILTSIGGSGLLYIGFQIIQDMTGELVKYSYKPPLTQHEAANVVFLALSVALIVLGIVSLAKGRFSRRDN